MDTARKLILLLLLSVAGALAADKTVTTTGAGGHTGANLANAWSLSEACAQALPGDVVNLRAGTYTDQLNVTHDGSSGSRIVFQAYPGDFVLLIGPGTHTPAIYGTKDYITYYGMTVRADEYDTSTYDEWFWVDITSAADNVIFRKMRVFHEGDVKTIYNTGGQGRQNGLFVSGASNMLIDSCYFRGGGNNASVTISGASHRSIVMNCDTIMESFWCNLIIGSDTYGNTDDYDIIVKNCIFWTSYGEDGIQTQPYYLSGGVESDLHEVRGVTITGNFFYDQRENWLDLKGSSGVVIENNIFCTSDGRDDGDMGSTNSSGGPGITLGSGAVSERCIVRNNVIIDGGSGIDLLESMQSYNNTLANNRRRYTGSNYTGDGKFGITTWNKPPGDRSIINTIILGQAGSLSASLKLGISGGANVRFDGNIYWDSSTTVKFQYNEFATANYISVTGLTAWRSFLNSDSHWSQHEGKDASSVSVDPELENFPISVYGPWDSSWDPSPKTTSPAIDAGVPHTYTDGTGSGVSAVTLRNVMMFTDGTAHVGGDSIKVGSSTPRRITSIDYDTQVASLSGTVSYADGDPVWWYKNGAIVNDIGANLTGIDVTPPDPPDPPADPPATPSAHVQPANGSTQSQPILFKWRKSAAATKYWFCLSINGWQTDLISMPAVADTFVSISGLPAGATCVWNVAAGNDAGWSLFTQDWTVYTSTQTFSQTVHLDWNKQIVPDTLEANAEVVIENLSRISNTLVLWNPDGYNVTWDIAIEWPGLSTPPQPGVGETGVYYFVRNGTKVFGFDLTKIGTGSGVTAGWVMTQLANYLNKNADIRLYGDQEFRRIVLNETSGPDSVIIADDNGVLMFWDSETGWKSLAELASGTGGSGDISGVAAGYGITGGGTSGDVTISVDTTKFTSQDTLGYATSDSTTQVLTVHKGKIRLATRPSGSSGISAATAAGMIHDSVTARANDYATVEALAAKIAYGDTSNAWFLTRAVANGLLNTKIGYSDTTLAWYVTRKKLNDTLASFLPLAGGTLTGTVTTRALTPSAAITYDIGTSAAAYNFGYFNNTQAWQADTIGGSTQTGSKYTYWENSLGYLRFGYQSNGTVSLYRYSYTGGAKTLFSLTTNSTVVNHAGTNNFDTLTVTYDHALTIGGYKAMTTQDSLNARTYSDSRYQVKPLGTAAEAKVLKWSVAANAAYWGNDSTAAGGGASDGQNADSLNGKILDTLGRDLGAGKYTVPAYVPDSLKYKHLLMVGFDSTGLSIGDSTACVLSVQANKIVITRQKNRSGSAAFSGTGQRVAVYIAGAKSTDRYFLQTYISGTTPPSAVDTRMGVTAKTDSLVVWRPASGTSGQTFYWWRVP